MSATNRGSQRERDDFYATPAWTTKLLLDKLDGLDRFSHIVEPACGEGEIIAELIGRGAERDQITGLELDRVRAETCAARFPGVRVENVNALTDMWDAAGQGADFTPTPSERTLVVTNPPFVHAMEFVKLGLAIIQRGGVSAMLLRLAFLESQTRRTFHLEHRARILVLPKRPSFCHSFKCNGSRTALHAVEQITLPASVSSHDCRVCGSKMKLTTTDSAAYAWFVWGDGKAGSWEVL